MMRTLAICCLLATPTVAQTATVQYYGSGCLAPPMVMEPAIRVAGTPRLASTITIRYEGIEGPIGTTALVPILLTGVAPAATPVPSGLLPQQRPGCAVQLKVEHATPMPPDPSQPWRFRTELSLRIPRLTTLLGASWCHQWAVAFLDCPGVGNCSLEAFGMSDAVMLRIGI
jgi:hypothetical protein